MINREYNINNPSAWLESYASENSLKYKGFRRRAVVTRFDGKWILMACVIEAIASGGKTTNKEQSRLYPDAVLFEDWLSQQDCLDMVVELNAGQLYLGDLSLSTTEANCRWSREQVPLCNPHMPSAGHVLSKSFHRERPNSRPLLSPGLPYYPDISEAVKDWLPFTTYHGHSDSHNGEVVFFLPETRAYLANAIAKEDSVEILVEGSKVNELDLRLLGAWWEGAEIRHFEENIQEGNAVLKVPSNVHRFEYVLIDVDGNTYDFHREDEYGHSGLGRNRPLHANGDCIQIVMDACRQGEGEIVEFKPFTRLDEGSKDKKLGEVVRSVVAFANTKGGRVFFGIDDDCTVVGINEQLQKWAKEKPSQEVCEKYLNALKSEIRDRVIGDPMLNFYQVEIDNMFVAIIDVVMAAEKPIEIRQDPSLYIRRGASNTRAFPNEWENIVGRQDNFWGRDS